MLFWEKIKPKEMKRILLAWVICTLFTNLVDAQKHVRVATGESALYECNILGNDPATNAPFTKTPEPYFLGLYAPMKFDSIGQKQIGTEDFVIISILNYKEEYTDKLGSYNYLLTPDEKATLDAEIGTEQVLSKTERKDKNRSILSNKRELLEKLENSGKFRYFLLSKSDFEGKSVLSTGCNCGELVGGSLTVPIKMRFDGLDNKVRIPNVQDFSKDITIGAVAGWRFQCARCKTISFVPFVGLGITSISLDSANTNGAIISASDRSGITATTGIMIENKKGLQVGLMVGWDYLGRKENIDWMNNGNMWFGFGVGFALFSEASSATETAGNNTEQKRK
jgi:hypothetical protein